MMTSPRRDTILQRAPELEMALDSNNELSIRLDGQKFQCSAHGLTVLDVFAHPMTFAAGLEALRTRVQSAQDWMELASTVNGLYQNDILRDVNEEKAPPSLTKSPGGYAAPASHVAMLNDRARTAAFIAGIREVVRPGDVVVDIGTGTGVFAAAAAQAGARHVYAIEVSSIGEVAQRVFAANGLEDRITLITGRSSQVTLPERANVLVSEMVGGGDPLGGDHLMEVFADARKRLLTPDARYIPRRLRIFGLPVSVPREKLSELTVVAENLRQWREWYGLDLESLREAQSTLPPSREIIQPYRARDWEFLSEPVLLADIDLSAITGFEVDVTRETTMQRAGELSGVLVYFEQQLGEDIWQSTHPQSADENCFRSIPLWILPVPLQVKEYETLAVQFRSGLPGVSTSIDARIV